MGIRTLVSKLKIHTLGFHNFFSKIAISLIMRFQIALLFVLVAAATAGSVDYYRQQASAGKANANIQLADTVEKAQSMLNEKNIGFDVKKHVDRVLDAVQQKTEAQNQVQNLQRQAKTAQGQMNQALNGIKNQKLRWNLKNLL